MIYGIFKNMDYIQLNPFDTEPLYRQLKNCIKRAILSGRLRDQDELPSENTLVTLYDISSTVIKSAYTLLEEEGLIHRVRGKGTFVHHPMKPIIVNLPFVHDSNQHIHFEVTPLAGMDLASDSPIMDYFPKAQTITKIRRLIKMNGILTTYQEVFLPNQPRDVFHDIFIGKRGLKEVILHSATQPKKGQWINRHGMKKATHIEASFLHIPEGAPLHKLASTIYDQGKLIGLVFTFIRGDIVAFRYDKKL